MYDVLYDPEKQVGVLIDAEAGRALGPLLSGTHDVVVPLFDGFVGGINADPATLHPSDLDHLFRGFIEAVAADEQPAEAAAAGAEAGAEQPAAAAGAEGAAAAGAEPVQAAQAAPPAPAEPAQPGEQGGIAGPAVGTEQSRPTGGTAPGEQPAAGIVADGGQSTGIEQARPAEPGQPGAEGAEQAAAGGIPKAPAA